MRKITFLCGILIIALLCIPQWAKAAGGLPDSPRFGYGARVDLQGTQISLALPTAASVGVEWIAITLDWASVSPDPAGAPNLAAIDPIMVLAQQNQLSVLISITNAPAWVLTASGPDAARTAELILTLARRYPGVLLAVEPFPGANTRQGWGAAANPAAYAVLLQTVHTALENDGEKVVLAAAGLAPLLSAPTEGDVDDLAFLEGLYNAGAQPYMPIVSLCMPQLTGVPMTPPDSPYVLRRFEKARQVMLHFNDRLGLIWITRFAWPSQLTDAASQAEWLSSAYKLLGAQLFIGAAFFQQLNPSPADPNGALIQPDQQLHPGFISLAQAIRPEQDVEKIVSQHFLIKRIINKLDYKHR